MPVPPQAPSTAEKIPYRNNTLRRVVIRLDSREKIWQQVRVQVHQR